MSPLIKTDTQSIEESRHPYQKCEHQFIKKEGLTAHQKSSTCDYQASYVYVTSDYSSTVSANG